MFVRILFVGWIVWVCDLVYVLVWIRHGLFSAGTFEAASVFVAAFLLPALVVTSIVGFGVAAWREHRRWR